MSIKEQVMQALDNMTEDEQKQVLELVQSIKQNSLPPGTPGEVLIELAHQLDFSAQDIAEMNEAIKGFDRIDWDEWQ